MGWVLSNRKLLLRISFKTFHHDVTDVIRGHWHAGLLEVGVTAQLKLPLRIGNVGQHWTSNDRPKFFGAVLVLIPDNVMAVKFDRHPAILGDTKIASDADFMPAFCGERRHAVAVQRTIQQPGAAERIGLEQNPVAVFSTLTPKRDEMIPLTVADVVFQLEKSHIRRLAVGVEFHAKSHRAPETRKWPKQTPVGKICEMCLSATR